MSDSFKLGNKEFNSRFILGSGSIQNELINSAINCAGAEIVTVAMRKSYRWEFKKISWIIFLRI